jgi:hypothetical protein
MKASRSWWLVSSDCKKTARLCAWWNLASRLHPQHRLHLRLPQVVHLPLWLIHQPRQQAVKHSA